MLPRTFRDPKSVCVSSFEAGPRSWDLGAEREGLCIENLRFRGRDLGGHGREYVRDWVIWG